MSDTHNQDRSLNQGRTLVKGKPECQTMSEAEQEKAALEAKVWELEAWTANLQSQLAEAEKRNRYLMDESRDISTRFLKLIARAKRDNESMRSTLDETKAENANLKQLIEGSPRARGVGRGNHKYKDEILRLRVDLAQLQAENRRMRWETYLTATEILEDCSHLVDPRTTLYNAMKQLADYADGNSETPPTAQQVNELDIFQDFLENRTEVLEQAIKTPNPVPLLHDLDEKWEGMLERHNWGAPCRFRMATVMVAGLQKSAKDSTEHREAVAKMKQVAEDTKQVLGHHEGIVDEINDLVDELE